MWIQNTIILILVSACVLYVAKESFSALVGRKSKIGSCCSKGCATVAAEQANPAKPAEAKVHFIPLESLARRSK